MFSGLSSDLKTAWRVIAKSPAFAVTVVTTLALTIALSTVVFSVLETILLRALPYSGVDRIVSLRTYSPQGYTQPASYPEYRDWRQNSQSFSALAAYNALKSVNFESGSSVLALRSVATSDNFFDVFGVKPMLGRTFRSGEERDGQNSVAVLSNEVWRTVFNGNRDAVGASVKIDGRGFTVVGVMPPGFRFPIAERDAVYYPFHLTAQQKTGRGNHWLPVVGRLKPGVRVEAANAEFNSVLNALGHTYPDTKGRKAKVIDISTFTTGKSSSTLRLLLCAVIILLTIGCVNIAGLISSRAIRLERETAVRSALGAGRWQLIRQFLLETALYGLCGGVAGVAIALGLIQVIGKLLVLSLNRGSEVSINTTVLAISLAVSIATAMLAGLLPGIRLSATSASLALRSGGRTGTDRHQLRLRGTFAVTQIALAMMLLATAGFLLQTLSSLQNTKLGFDPAHILTADIELSSGSYEGRNVLANFYDPLLERVRALPGVKSAGLIQILPIQTWGWNSDVEMDGQPAPAPNEERLAEYRVVTPGFHMVFQDKLVRGRYLDAKLDSPNSQRVMVVNETFVRRFIPAGQDPIGKATLDGDAKVTIVGVVRDLRQDIKQEPLAEMDMPISQMPADVQLLAFPSMRLVVRTAGRPELLAGPLREAFRQVDKTIPFRTPESMQQIVADALTFERLENWLMGSFAALAVLLALIGLYGLISEEVQSSARDIGVRMALGATRVNIFGRVYRRVGILLVPGLALGLFGVFAARQLIESTVAASLTGSVGAVLALTSGFALVAILASSIPARQAASLDPMQCLRDN